MPDHLDPLFDDLRRRELPRVRPPGAEAVRRTVHRRATVRATAYAVVLMAAGGSFVLAQRSGAGDGVAPAAPPSSSAMAFSGGPVPSSSEGLWRGLPDKSQIVAGLVPAADHTDVMADFTQDVGLEAQAGRHRLRVGCSGPAPLPVTIMLGSTVDQQDTIPCEDAGVVREYELTLTAAGSVRVLLGSGGQFDAYALKLTKI